MSKRGGGLRRRGRDAKLERLAGVQLFSACNKRDLARIAAHADEIEVRAGTTLIRQGELGRECFVIMSGTAKATIRGKATFKLGPGACFGEMALLDSGPRSATVSADTDMRLLVLGSRDFSALLSEVPIIGRRVMTALAQRLREAERLQPYH